jgi:uncharacterized protein (TIRG00374 family)
MIIAIGLLLLLFSRVDIAAVFDTLVMVNPLVFAAALMCYLLIRYVMAWQMSLGLSVVSMSLSIWDLFKIKLIAGFYSLLVPGELVAGGVAWYRLARPRARAAEAAALLVYFRLVNMLVLLGIGLLGLYARPMPGLLRIRTVVGVMGAGVACLLLPFFSPAFTRILRINARAVLRRYHAPRWLLSQVRALWGAVLAFHSLATPSRSLLVVGMSLLMHALGVVNYALLAEAVGLHLSVFVLGWIRTFVAIVQLIPVSVGGLGLREAGLVLLLRDYGTDERQALSFALLVLGDKVAGAIVGGILEARHLVLGAPRSTRVFDDVDDMEALGSD